MRISAFFDMLNNLIPATESVQVVEISFIIQKILIKLRVLDRISMIIFILIRKLIPASTAIKPLMNTKITITVKHAKSVFMEIKMLKLV